MGRAGVEVRHKGVEKQQEMECSEPKSCQDTLIVERDWGIT